MGVWWGGDGVTSEGVYLKYWKIDRLRAWFPRKGCSCSANCFWRWLASFALRLENKRRSIALLYEERWEEESWFSHICEITQFSPRNVALATTLCTWHLKLNVAGASSWGKRQGSTAATTKLAALVTPTRWWSMMASATDRRSRSLRSRNSCLCSDIETTKIIYFTTLGFARAHARACICVPVSLILGVGEKEPCRGEFSETNDCDNSSGFQSTFHITLDSDGLFRAHSKELWSFILYYIHLRYYQDSL